MLVNAGTRDERGSALVSVLVMMLVLTMFALTLAAIVTNTSSTLVSGRSTSQARAAADAGVAAGLAAFKKAEGCTVPIRSTTAPVYSVTCTDDTRTSAVTFLSTGSADDGRQASVRAVYGYTTAQSYEAKVGQLTFFSATTMFQPNIVTSTTPAPAKVIVAVDDFHCASVMAANVVVERDFIGDYGCHVTGWVKAKRSATLSADNKILGNLTAGKNVTLNSSSSVGGTLTSGGNTKLSSNSSVGGDLASAGFVELDSGTSVGGNVTSTSYSDVEGTVKGDVASGSYVTTWSDAKVAGSVTAAGNSQTLIRGTVGKDVTAAGAVTTDYNSVVTGRVIAAGSSASEVRGKVGGDFSAGGAIVIQHNGSVAGNARAAGTGATTVSGAITGGLQVAGAVTVNGTVSGDVTAAGTGMTVVKGTVGGSLKAAGAVDIDWNATVIGDVSAAGTAEASSINGTIRGSVELARAVTINGNISGDLTAAGTGETSVKGGTLAGSLKVAGTVRIESNRRVGANVTTSGSGTDVILGQVSGNLTAGGPVYLDGGSIDGSLTLPNVKQLTFRPSPLRVTGTVTSAAAPSAPRAPAAPSAPTAPSPPSEVKISAPSSPTIPTWQSYIYDSADWPGYTKIVVENCDKRDWATELKTYSKPTVVDATGCKKGLDSNPAGQTTVEISTNIVVVSTGKINLSFITFEPNPTVTPSVNLWFIGQSEKNNAKFGEIRLDSTNISVPSLLYTPGDITFQRSRFTGSMYAEGIVFSSGSPGNISAAPVDFPIALFDAEQAPTTETFSPTLISQREIG